MLSHYALIVPLFQLGFMAPDARVVLMSSSGMYSSKMLDPEDLDSNDILASYKEGETTNFEKLWTLSGRSKAGQVVFTRELQARLNESQRWKDVSVSACHPGEFEFAVQSSRSTSDTRRRTLRSFSHFSPHHTREWNISSDFISLSPILVDRCSEHWDLPAADRHRIQPCHGSMGEESARRYRHLGPTRRDDRHLPRHAARGRPARGAGQVLGAVRVEVDARLDGGC